MKNQRLFENQKIDRAGRTEDVLFCILAAGTVCFIGGLFLLHAFGLDWIAQGAPCNIYRLTGWYCLGCGGTRAVKALLHGRIISSFLYHPAVVYLAAWMVTFLLWQSVHYLSHGRIRGFRYWNWQMWVAAGLFLLNFLIKNAAQLMG